MTVASGGTLRCREASTLGNDLYLAGNGASGGTGLGKRERRERAYGAVSLTGDAEISSDTGTLSIDGTRSPGPAAALTLVGSGSGSISGNIQTDGGTLTIAGTAPGTLRQR